MSKELNKQDRRLFEAVREGDLSAVRHALQQGAKVNAKDKDGWTALMWAADKGRLEVVEFLVEEGAKVNAKDKDGWTALMGAARGVDLDTVKRLIGKGANVNAATAKEGLTPLMLAVRFGHSDTVSLLIKGGANVNAKDNEDEPVLMQALSQVHSDSSNIVKQLIDGGADVNARDCCGRTIFTRECQLLGRPDVAKLMLDKGAEIDDQGSYKIDSTPLMCAAREKNLGLLKLLINEGADTNVISNREITALMISAWKGHLEAVEALLEANTYVHARNWQGETALTLATDQGHQDVVALLKTSPRDRLLKSRQEQPSIGDQPQSQIPNQEKFNPTSNRTGIGKAD